MAASRGFRWEWSLLARWEKRAMALYVVFWVLVLIRLALEVDWSKW